MGLIILEKFGTCFVQWFFRLYYYVTARISRQRFNWVRLYNGENRYNTTHIFLIRRLNKEINNICFDDNLLVTQHSINVCKGALNMMNPITKASVGEKLANAVKQRIKHLQRKENGYIVPRSIPQYVVGIPNVRSKMVGF